MDTPLHSFYTWALAKHGVKAGRAAGISGAVGAAFPDIPSFVATAYYIGPVYLRDGWSSMDTEEVLDAIYFTGPFGATGSALHSAVPVALLLVSYRLLGLGRRDARRMFLWFLLGWLGHTVVDFLTHVDDGRPLFWPLSDWLWSSPVSYYNSEYYGREFSLISNGGAVAVMAFLLVKRIVKRGESPSAKESGDAS
ncbi:MAG: metal-dependent hydrolase [Actinomycetota bacterium]|nr:metal-dependent hydrolase [Rubrobacter sp.]MDQ3506769.1 metal-dependent hydrolase [Actinomycetota bacterium]